MYPREDPDDEELREFLVYSRQMIGSIEKNSVGICHLYGLGKVVLRDVSFPVSESSSFFEHGDGACVQTAQ